MAGGMAAATWSYRGDPEAEQPALLGEGRGGGMGGGGGGRARCVRARCVRALTASPRRPQ